MATFHLSLKNGIVGTAKNHAEYILREGRYSDRSRKEELVHKAANLPAWAEDAVEFFDMADIYERTNGRAYVEFEIALPNEIDLEENILLLEKFIESNVGSDKVWAYAVHSKQAAFDDSQIQIHAHVMFSERTVTNEMASALAPSKFFRRYNVKNPNRGGYKKDRRFSDKKIARENIKKVRKDWEKLVNNIYEEKNIDRRISSETLKKQKEEAERIYDYALASFLDREPQEHLGPKLTNIIKKTVKNKNITQENLDDVLDEIYMISPKAFCLVIDQLEKEQKEIEYKKELKQRQMHEEMKTDDAALSCPEPNAVIVISGKEITEIIESMEDNLVRKIMENNEEIKKIKSMLLSEKQIGYMALSICTRGQSKKLMKEKRRLVKSRKNHQEELSMILAGGRPSFWQQEARKKYDDKVEELTDELEKVESQLLRIRIDSERISRLMSNEENKEKMVTIINKLQDRQKARIEYVKVLEDEQTTLKNINNKIGAISDGINIGRNYKVERSAYVGIGVKGKTNQNKISEIMKGLNSLENLLKRAEIVNKISVTKKNNMRINLSGSKEKGVNQFEW